MLAWLSGQKRLSVEQVPVRVTEVRILQSALIFWVLLTVGKVALNHQILVRI